MMKKIVLAVTGICFLAIGAIFMLGFFEKQNLENNGGANYNSTSNSSSAPSEVSGSNRNTANSTASSQTFTLAEVSKHSSQKDCWLAINGSIYDVSKYIIEHPGGSSSIIQTCGSDATVAFKTMNRSGNKSHSSFANQLLNDYFIGKLE